MSERIDKEIARFEIAKANRANWDTLFEQVASLVHPSARDFTSESAPGTRRNLHIYDSTAPEANVLFSASIIGALMNPSIRWFNFSLGDEELEEEKDIQEWLSEVVEICLDHINNPRANFYTSVQEMNLEFGAFGNGVIFLAENRSKDGLLFSARTLSEVCIAESEAGVADTFYFLFSRTAQQMHNRWGEDVSEDVKKAWRDNSDRKFKVMHIIQPRQKRNPSKRDNKNMPFESLYFEYESKQILEEGGFEEQSIFAPRISKSPKEVYGRGPGVMKLPDIKQANICARGLGMNVQLNTEPPIIEEEGSIVGPARILPRGRIRVKRGMQFPQPLALGGNSNESFQYLEYLGTKIVKGFFIDLLQTEVTPSMTATEFIRREGNRGQLLLSLLGRYISEFLSPCLERVFAILQRQRKFPAPPMALDRLEIRPVFTSPLAMLQKQAELEGLTNTLNILAPFLQADPRNMGIFNFDKIAREASAKFGSDPEFIKSSDEIEGMKEAESQQQAINGASDVVQKLGGLKEITEAINGQ